ncbi:MAG: hypothetical protein AAGH92_05270 [Planctomycetota bacterium]
MPAYRPPKTTWRHWLFLAVYGALLIGLFVTHPYVCGTIIAGLAALVALSLFTEDHHREQMIEARRGESICGFARSFDCRQVDTWVVRAVYEASTAAAGFPVRADDDEVTLDVDRDIFDFIAEEVAQRSGRTFENAEANPYYTKVTTLRNMVRFFCGQPRGDPTV